MQPEIQRAGKKVALESILAVFLLPQPCHIFHSELPELCGALPSHFAQTTLKANSSFILEIMKKSVRKRLQ